MDIYKGDKSQGTLGTEGTRVHQVTDGHLQRTKVSRYTGYITEGGYTKVHMDIYKGEKSQGSLVHLVQKGRGYTKV